MTEPGLHVKLPFIQNAIYIDRRVLDFDAEPQEVILGDQKRLVVDAFARYKILDPLRFYQSVGSEELLRGRIDTILDASLRKVLGEVPLFTVLSADRAALMNSIRDQANTETKQFGIDIVDVRIKRADLPAENSQAIYRRMQTEREREAKELRAQGAELAQRIRSRADRERRVIIAEAEKEGEIIRGEGDAQAIRIFAEAFGQDVDFFTFYRSMQAYRRCAGGRQHELRVVAGQRVLPLLQRSRHGAADRKGRGRSARRCRDRRPRRATRGAAERHRRDRRSPGRDRRRVSRPGAPRCAVRADPGTGGAGSRRRGPPPWCDDRMPALTRGARAVARVWRLGAAPGSRLARAGDLLTVAPGDRQVERRRPDDRSGDRFGVGAGAGGLGLGGVAEQHEARRSDRARPRQRAASGRRSRRGRDRRVRGLAAARLDGLRSPGSSPAGRCRRIDFRRLSDKLLAQISAPRRAADLRILP